MRNFDFRGNLFSTNNTKLNDTTSTNKIYLSTNNTKWTIFGVTSKGRADCVVETPKYVYIFEYKLDHPASEAIAQINEKGYAAEYASDPRKVYKIGCSFSSETGTISDFLVE